ncbi:MAG: DNA alkylation repair protein [Spirochaetales bacterium]|nr:DNA alkylation repair protein [Spirochaetales bacterium]
MQEITEQLITMKDEVYKNFHGKLMPTINPDTILGVRVPLLRKFSNQLNKNLSKEEIERFMSELPHRYYEENNIHAFLIEKINDYDECIAALDKFLPYVDNWATCDMMNPKIFKKNTRKLFDKIEEWMSSSHVYTIRFGIGMLMRFYLDDNFSTQYLDMVANIVSDEYYVNMMKAWFFATALAKQYEATLPYIQQNRLDIWSHNKAIQKSIESFRVSKEHKEELRRYKRK